jgi:hypothetical protein
VTVGRVGFQQYIPEKQKRFGIKLHKLCDSKRYTYDMVVYLHKQCANADENVTPTHRTVLQVKRRVETVKNKLFMGNYFSLPLLLHKRKTDNCGLFMTTERECQSILGQSR